MTVQSRRAFIRGTSGTIIGLPLVSFTFHNGKIIAAENDVPERMFTMFFPNGAPGNVWNFDGVLKELTPFKSKMLAVRNLSNKAGFLTNLPEGHGSGAATCFTGIKVPDLNTKQVSGGPTIEHYLAERLNHYLLVPHLAIGLTSQSGHHTNQFGIHCYTRSWKNNTPIVPVQNPLDIFNSIFGPAWQSLIQRTDKEKARLGSVLDTIKSQYQEVLSERYGLGKMGRELLSNHLDSIRDMEKKVVGFDQNLTEQCKNMGEAPQSIAAGISYERWDEVLRLQMDLLFHAVSCDITRYASISFGESAEYYHNPKIGISSGHECAHRYLGTRDEASLVSYLGHITHTLGLFGYFFSKLDSITEANGKTMLENSVSYIATELGDQSITGHAVHPTVALIAGGRGRIATGRELDASGRNTNDALITCIRGVGLDDQTFGDPTFCQGPLA